MHSTGLLYFTVRGEVLLNCFGEEVKYGRKYDMLLIVIIINNILIGHFLKTPPVNWRLSVILIASVV